MKSSLILTLVLGFGAAFGQSELVVDRGLPAKNLNNESGAEARSNIRWSWYETGFVGDDISIGNAGESWVIDSVKVWTVPGGKTTGDPDFLGDLYRDVRLYFGSGEEGVSPVVTGRLERGSNQPASPQIAIREARQSSGEYVYYEDFGATVRVWEIEFSGLNLDVAGGSSYVFGAFGLGRPVPGDGEHLYPWFNHASNSSLGAANAQGSDGELRLFKGSGQSAELFVSQGKGWNKNSDINVQVFAHRANTVRPVATR
jgi:hypothetical protein